MPQRDILDLFRDDWFLPESGNQYPEYNQKIQGQWAQALYRGFAHGQMHSGVLDESCTRIDKRIGMIYKTVLFLK